MTTGSREVIIRTYILLYTRDFSAGHFMVTSYVFIEGSYIIILSQSLLTLISFLERYYKSFYFAVHHVK